MINASNSVIEHTARYDDTCDGKLNCTATIKIPKTMQAPVYFYYRLENFYQNHRSYVKSRNDNQLRGEKVTSYQELQDCEPFKSLDDKRDPEFFYLPCGLIARSMFNDTFVLRTEDDIVPLRKNGIAWTSDKEKKFKNPPASAVGIRIIPDFEDEDFIVWMRTAGLPDFKKLYRIIDQDLQGNYTIDIQNNYDVSSFSGKKYIVISTTSWIGGKNPFLGYAYIIVGIICFVQGIVFLVKHKVSPRKLGDTKYLEWNK